MKRSRYGGVSSAIASIGLLVLIGCTTKAAQNSRNVNIIGLWEEKGPTVHAITLRKADGTYRQKVIQLYDYARSPLAYQADGRWRINGEQYISTLDHVSAPLWKKYIGKQWNMKILASDTKLFKYLSTDGAVVEERRIGDASDAAFDRIRLGKEIKNRLSN
ncbi:MAG: hypothetical protein V7609_96 [Verrucomicrobiota bacterium]